MKYLVIILIPVVLMGSTSGQQYPDGCVSCTNAGADSIPLLPLSYNTVRSNVFNGTQPSNQGCTNGATVNGQVTINCGQGTTLIDCDRGLTTNPDYSDLSNTFAWNRTTSVAGQVSIVFRFYQQINISRISLFFWNSQSNSIIVPNVMMHWSNDDSITPSEVTNFILTGGSPNRNGDGRRRLNFDASNAGLQFQFLRLEMTFYDLNEWIFLSEVFFCGNTAPYYITHPSTDNDVQIVSPNATMASVTCSLNVTIPSNAVVLWIYNTNHIIDGSRITKTGNTTTLVIRNLQPSDAGVYQCEFNDALGSGWVLRRNIRLFITVPQIIQPPDDFNIIPFGQSTSSVQLMCSLNIPIPSSVTVIWTYNNNPFTITPPNEVTATGSTTILVIRNLQQSYAGVYQCTFRGLNLGRNIQLVFLNTSTTLTAATATITTDHNLTATTSTVPVVTDTNSIASSIYATMTLTTVTTYTSSSSNLPTSSSSFNNNSSSNNNSNNNNLNNNNNSSSVGIIVAVVVLVVVVFIIITVVVVGIIVVWKRKKSQQHAKPAEGVYYSTIDETLQRPPPSKPEAVYSEVNDKQDSKEPQYMDVTGGVHSTKQADKVIMQDNPAYSVRQTKDNPANGFSTPIDQQVEMQDNPAYSVANM